MNKNIKETFQEVLTQEQFCFKNIIVMKNPPIITGTAIIGGKTIFL